MKLQTPKGTRDIKSEEMRIRQWIVDKMRSIFETYGFQPLETPAIENWEVLSAKGTGGPEILNETYNFEDKAGRRIGLRYDLTVPLARFISTNPNIPLPFKRYQIEKVWRYGDIAKDRFREFLQADIDIVGSNSMLADAEIIACTISVFDALGFKDYFVRLNNRKILSALTKRLRVEKRALEIFRSIDKLGKIGPKNVKKELLDKGVSKDVTEKILNFVQIKALEKVEEFLREDKEGIEELKEIISYLKKMGIKTKLKIDLSLARGLDYYTGPIFEVFAEKGIGSLAGGGRYDKMIGLFLGRSIAATGISFGLERIIEVMKKRKIGKVERNKIKAFVAAVDNNVRKDVLKIVQTLRKNNISTDFDFRNRSLTKQLEYANSVNIPIVVIVGKKELEKNSVKIRDMKTGKEKIVKIKSIPSNI